MKKRQLSWLIKENGFTLVEVLVSLVVITIIMVPLYTSYVFFSQSAARAGQTEIALMLAQDEMEKVLATPYEDLVTSTDPPAEIPSTNHSGYSYIISVGEKTPDGSVFKRKITVTVKYPLGEEKLVTERVLINDEYDDSSD